MSAPDAVPIRRAPETASEGCPAGTASLGRRTRWCKVALVSGSGPQPGAALEGLLWQRLRIAALIILAVMTAFFLRSLLEKSDPAPTLMDLGVHGCVVVLI